MPALFDCERQVLDPAVAIASSRRSGMPHRPKPPAAIVMPSSSVATSDPLRAHQGRVERGAWDTKPTSSSSSTEAGEPAKAATAFHVVNPVTGERIAELPLASEADLDEALETAERTYPEWRSTDVDKRSAILHKAAKLLKERADDIGRILTQEQGKPIAEAKGEVFGAAQLFDWYAEEIKRDYGRVLVRPPGQLSRVMHEPVGPVATFTPWNFPIYLLAKKVAPRSPPAAR
jgi:acyl-CoA reductase-like NAD-dependent aldehyde dehydrogenase